MEGVLPLSRQRALFSLRSLKFFLCWLMMWQDGQVAWTPFQMHSLIPSLPINISAMEFILLPLIAVIMMERCLTMDFRIRRSYFTAPLV
ncbi:MAG TPA: hypothetical protein VGM92_05350, partial [Candidatus Kapabacteria bacterium]